MVRAWLAARRARQDAEWAEWQAERRRDAEKAFDAARQRWRVEYAARARAYAHAISHARAAREKAEAAATGHEAVDWMMAADKWGQKARDLAVRSDDPGAIVWAGDMCLPAHETFYAMVREIEAGNPGGA